MPDAVPLPQSPEFAAAMRLMGRPLRVESLGKGDDAIRWQVLSRRIGPLGQVDLISRGPALRDVPWANWLERVRGAGPLILNADGADPQMLRAAGFWPLVTPVSLALLPLGDADAMRAALRQKWRNRLNRAEALGLRVARRGLRRDDWLLAAEAEQARARGYRALPAALSRAFAQANPGKAVVHEVTHRGAPVAAVLMLRHGGMATWQTGHVTEEGKRLGAMNLALWQAMRHATEAGHGVLDLGPVNSDDAPGLAHFKLGTGARIHRLSGTWLYHRALAPLARRLPSCLAA